MKGECIRRTRFASNRICLLKNVIEKKKPRRCEEELVAGLNCGKRDGIKIVKNRCMKFKVV